MQLMQVLLRLAICIMLSMSPLQAQSDRLAAESKRGKELMEAKNFEEAIPVTGIWRGPSQTIRDPT